MLIAGGSIAGTAHTKPNSPGYTNNQDAFIFGAFENISYGIVCDGCSSSKHSEVGAKIAVKVFDDKFKQFINEIKDFPEEEHWTEGESIYEFYKEYIKSLMNVTHAMNVGNDFKNVVMDYFLFTVVFFISLPEKTFICSVGDGVYAVNGEITKIEAVEKNKPQYLGYGFINKDYRPSLNIVEIPTENIETLMIGSDGVNDLIAVENKIIPMSGESVGYISQFWDNPKMFLNADMVRRRLAIINHSVPYIDNGVPMMKVGLLPDDTTLIVWRKS